MLETALAVAGTATGVALVNKIADTIGWYAAPHQVIRTANAEAKAEIIRVGPKESQKIWKWPNCFVEQNFGLP